MKFIALKAEDGKRKVSTAFCYRMPPPHKAVVRHIFGHNSTRRHNDIVANGHTRKNGHIAAQPDIAAKCIDGGRCSGQNIREAGRWMSILPRSLFPERTDGV